MPSNSGGSPPWVLYRARKNGLFRALLDRLSSEPPNEKLGVSML